MKKKVKILCLAAFAIILHGIGAEISGDGQKDTSGLLLSSSDPQMRIWTNRAGVKKIKRTMCGLSEDGKTVSLRDAEGRVKEFKLEAFSQLDIDYIRKIARENGYYWFAGRYWRLSGIISLDEMCLYSGAGLVVVSSRQLDEADENRIRKAQEKQKELIGRNEKLLGELRRYVAKRSISYMPNDSTAVKDVGYGYLIKDYASKKYNIFLPAVIGKSGFDPSQIDLTGRRSLPPYHRWEFGAYCYFDDSNIREEDKGGGSPTRYWTTSLQDAAVLLIGWGLENQDKVHQEARQFIPDESVDYNYTPRERKGDEKIESIEFTYSGKGRALASGTAVAISNDGYFLTCYHVVAGRSNVLVQMPRWSEWAEVVAVDAHLDAAILKVNRVNQHCLILENRRSVSQGDQVVSFSYPQILKQGLSLKVSEGHIANSNRFGTNEDRFQISTPVYHGSSGGAVVNRSGRLIGIVGGGMESDSMVNYSIKGERLARFIRLNLPNLYERINLERLDTQKEMSIDQIVNDGRQATALVVVYGVGE